MATEIKKKKQEKKKKTVLVKGNSGQRLETCAAPIKVRVDENEVFIKGSVKETCKSQRRKSLNGL